MSQTVWSAINPATESGTQLAQALNDFKDALMSGLSGTSRPPQTTAGGAWIDTTNAGTPNFYWSYKIFDGSNDIEVFKVNLATGRATIAGTDSTFLISKTSADSVGPLLKFLKERVASNGQLLTDDIVGEIRFTGAASDDSNPDVASIQVVAIENETSSQSGCAIIFETTPAGEIAAVEMLRIVNKKLGIGITLPTAGVHSHNQSGVKSSVESADANGAKMTLTKGRAASSGGVHSGDVIGQQEFEAQDSTDAKTVAALIEVSASELHSGTNKGTILKVKTTTTAAASPDSKLEIGDIVETVSQHKLNATLHVAQSVATSATLNQVSAAKRVVEFTGSTVTSVRGFNSGHASKVLTIHNRSSVNVTLEHENANATAADRLTLPNSAAVTLLPQQSVELYYCIADSRWKLKGGAGGSGSGGAGSLEWIEDDLAPTPSVDTAKNRVYLYDSGAGQNLYAAIKVPSTYLAGRPISLILPFYSPDSSGTGLLQTVATLIRTGTDAVTSTTNQRTSTNAAVTLGAGTVNIPQKVTFDLTSTVGAINSVAVSANDLILIKLTRGTDTGTSQLSALINSAEVTFS